jgi:subtilisin family serine protease
LESYSPGLLGVTGYLVHNGSGKSIGSVIPALAAFQIAGAQANYTYALAQDLAQDPDLAGRTQEGDAAQYALGKLGLVDIHRRLKGANVSVAVIDSQIDFQHPDLDGVIAEQFDAVGTEDKPHPHGTGMAGAIASHRRLMGIAPSARLYAVHAFSNGAASAESTTFNILKGLDWAASKGVRVINMSFAGPRDPSLERALKSAHDKGIVLIAAAGNAGPKSPPLYPGADPNVIAVTATDINDKVFSGANRGRYIAVAAPGVDILVPAPEGSYQLTTGTSVAAAEVSGIAALLLERNPDLTPDDVRKILTASARRLGTKDRDDDYGSGMVDPSKAVQTAGDLTQTVITGSPPRSGANPKQSR